MRSAGGLMLLALMVAVAEAQDRAPCPPAEVFPRADWAAGANCTVITFAGSISTATPVQNPLWVEGLRMYANFTNGQGGLRLGKGHIGYVEIQITDLASSYYPNPTAKDHYEGLCEDGSVDVLLGPISSNVARDVLVDLKHSNCSKPFVVADTSEQLFQLDADTLWSVEGWNATQKGDEPIKFLHTLGARTYAIVTQGTAAYEDMANALRNAIYSYTDTRLLDSVKWTGGVSMINELAIELESKVPDAFIGVGDLDMFESLLNEFKGQKYGPKAAFFMEGLAASAYMQQESYLTKGCSRCVVYNQWMGTVPWSEQMPYQGRNNWTAIQEGDPYGDRGSGSSADRRNQRYIGSAADFGKLAHTRLSAAHSRLSQPDAYHAKAFASLLMLQMALELAPDGNGGLALEKLRQPQEMRKAKVALDVNTFWGRIKLRRDGFNEGFRMGIAQFQKHDPVPNLVGPAASFSSTTAEALYPAVWPCNLYDTCDITEGWSLWEVLGALLLGAVGVLVSIGCYLKLRSGPGGLMATLRQISFLSRESLYSRTTDHLLAEAGVSATWYTAANAGDSALDPAPDGVPPGIMVDTGDTRMLKHQRSPAPVLFRDQHIGDLRPKTWRDQRIGKGSYGTVYRATWKGKDVAVKELKVPEEPSDLSSREKELFIQQAKDLRDEFLKELKVSCDLSHPNLVRLLGWATSTECPMVIQEYLAGKALDHQLYVEKWRPTEEDVLKIGLDVARGMEYLHTAFVNLTNHTVPVIHRDLKSPNLLLLYPPDSSSGGGERQQVWVKIADFGLARNKKLDEASRGRAVQTGMMTGCGSVLWMAPEILLGDAYNEKVDVFSYAMCLAELRSGHLPWQGGKSRIDTTQVPYKVTRGQRPTWQLTKGRDKEVKKDFLNALIQRCWDQTPSRRPEFQTIADEIGKQYTAAMRGMRRGSITIDDRPPSPPVIGGSE